MNVPYDIRGNRHRWPSSFIYFSDRMSGGISLGQYVILSARYVGDVNAWYHERGHHLQSMILGPLFLPLVGLPSGLWALYFSGRSRKNYYSFLPERSANRLGRRVTGEEPPTGTE